MADVFNLDAAIRKVPDFPHEGILFYDITSVLAQPDAFAYCIRSMVDRYAGVRPDAIAAVESRGFLFAAPLATELSVPLLLVRKAGKLPGETVSKTYELEYGLDTIEMHRADVRAGMQVLIVDDLIATGGTVRAAADLIVEAGSSVPEVFSVIGLPFLGFKEKLAPVPVHTLIDYEAE